MLTVFARTFMTATRTTTSDNRNAPKPTAAKRRWLPDGHWWKETRGTAEFDKI